MVALSTLLFVWSLRAKRMETDSSYWCCVTLATALPGILLVSLSVMKIPEKPPPLTLLSCSP